MRLRVLATAAALIAALAVPMPAAADTLRVLAPSAGIRIGAAVDVEALKVDAAYARLLAREFNVVTPENAMKFSVVQAHRRHREAGGN